MCADAKLDEWKLVLDQFHALVREGSDNIEDILDIQFRRRFSQLIDQGTGAAWRRWDDKDNNFFGPPRGRTAQTSHRKREPQRVPSGS